MRWLRPRHRSGPLRSGLLPGPPPALLARDAARPQPAAWPCGGPRRWLRLPPAVLPPLIFTGLFLTLWCWKCTMLVLFQNAIIYNPFMPPNARSMRISEFARLCGGIQWREERIRSLDGTTIALCISELPSRGAGSLGRTTSPTPVYILYFQGNASSLPPRLPDISWVLRRLKDADEPIHYTTVCLSYRGYWTSHDRPSERGINMDARAALQWITQFHRDRAADGHSPKPVFILWGQSIGCGFATNLAAMPGRASDLSIDALILETPFTNTRAMLKALYPQRWLPYQHLWPFLRSHLDSLKNFGAIAANRDPYPPDVYIVEAAKDELVPQDHGAALQQRCEDLGLAVKRTSIPGALHNGVMARKGGKQAIADSICAAVTRASARPGAKASIVGLRKDGSSWLETAQTLAGQRREREARPLGL